MKITKRQLKRIIKEEKAKLTAENRVRKAVREALLKEAVNIGVSEDDLENANDADDTKVIVYNYL